MKTLVVYNGNVIGATEEEMQVGDVITIEIKDGVSAPLTVHQVLPVPKSVGFDPEADPATFTVSEDADDSKGVDIEWEPYKDYDFVAYLSYNEKATKKYTKKTSQRLEKRMAKTLGGHTTPGSGAFDTHKGDVRAKDWLGEHKFTDAAFYRLNLATWAKIKREAFEVSKTPILEVVLDQEKSHVRMMFMDLHDFYERTHCSEEEFVNLFYLKQLKPRTNSSSVTLKAQEVSEHVKQTFALTQHHVPAWFLTYNEKTTLMGLRATDFETIFKEEE